MTVSEPKILELPVPASLRADMRVQSYATPLFSGTAHAVLGVSKASAKADAVAGLSVSKESPKTAGPPPKQD